MGLIRTVAPTVEPLTRAEAARHLRLDASTLEPVPEAPTVARVSPAAAGNLSAGVYRYRVTFVTDDGETDGGAISEAVTIMDAGVNGRVLVSALPLGGEAVTARRIYRTVAGGPEYFLVATVADNVTTEYTDNVADGSLGAGIPATNTTGDPEVAALILAARTHVEDRTRRALLRQTWRLTLDAFPCADDAAIALPRSPLIDVTEVTYVDVNGDTQVLDPATYTVDAASLPPRLFLAYGGRWPSTRTQRNAVSITFRAGFGTAAADVPAPLRAAMKLLIGHWYANRESVVTGTIATEVPMAVESLLAAWRVPEAA